MTDRAAMRGPGARLLWLGAALLALCGCTSTSRVQVNSTPSGARILIDGSDIGQTTPYSVELSTRDTRHSIRIEKPGFNPVEREVTLDKNVDVMDADEAAARICCAPCTLGCTLLGFLHPFKVDTAFRPSHIDASLEVAGQGARLEVSPPQFEAYVDGKLSMVLDGNYVMTAPGSHELEIKSAGYRSSMRTIRVDERMYQRIKVDLELEGQGLLVTGSPDGAKVYVDDQFQGTIGDVPRRVRAEPGAHMLRVEADGHRGWQEVVQVVADRYEEIGVDLKRAGQGLILRRPDDLPAKTPEVQILVDGQLAGSAFDAPIGTEAGEHQVEIRVAGYETKTLSVRVGKDEYLELSAGARIEKGRASKQVRLEATGLRVHAPAGIDAVAERDVEVLLEGALVGYGFENMLATGASPAEVTVTVRVKGYRPWEQRVRMKSGTILDLYPRLERE